MTQKAIRQVKCKITEQQLQRRFDEADLNGDGTLSADQITILLQSLGYQDTYKGTIRKLCRKMQKLNHLTKSNNQNQILKKQSIQVTVKDKAKQGQKQASDNQQNALAEPRHNATEQHKAQEQPRITFQQFKQYFDILQKPVGKMLFQLELKRKVITSQFNKKISGKNLLHKDKGQKIKANILVGQQKQHYNSSIDVQIWKQLKSKNKSEDVKFQLSMHTSSQENAAVLSQLVKTLYLMIIEMAAAEDQELGELTQLINMEALAEGNIAKFKITIQDDVLKELIYGYILSPDEVLSTEITYLIKFLFQFDFNFIDLKTNPDALIEDIITRNSNIKFQYVGSQFMDMLKQLALSVDAFQIIKIDPYSPDQLALISFLSMQKADLYFKLKNLQKSQASKQVTDLLFQSLKALQEMQSEQFSLKKLSELVDGLININAQVKNTRMTININAKDLLKLPYFRSGQGGGYQSD